MDLKEILEAIKSLPADQTQALVDGLRENAHGAYQKIYNLGHAEAETAAKAKLDDAQAKLTKAEADLADAERRAKEKSPDAEKMRADHAAELQKVQADAKADVEAAEAKLSEARMDAATSAVRAKLIAAGVDPDFADVKLEKAKARIRFTEEGRAEVLQDGLSIAFKDLPDGVTHLDKLAEEMVAATPDKFVTTDVKGGSGLTGGSGNTSGGPLSKAAERGKARGEAQKQAGTRQSIFGDPSGS